MKKRWITMMFTATCVVVTVIVVLNSLMDEVHWPTRLDPNGVQVKKSFTQPIEPLKKPWPELPIVDGPILTMGHVGGDEIRLPRDANGYFVGTDIDGSRIGMWKGHPDSDLYIRIRSRIYVFEPQFDLSLLLHDHASEDRVESLESELEEYEAQTDEAVFLRAIKSTYADFRAQPYDYVRTAIAYRGLLYREVEALDDGIEAYLYANDAVHVYSFGPSERRRTWLMVVFRATGEYVGEVIVWKDDHYELALAMARTMKRTRK